MTSPQPEPAELFTPRLPRHRRFLAIGVCVVVAIAVVTASLVISRRGPARPSSGAPAVGSFSHHAVVIKLPSQSSAYLGLFVKGVPRSYAPVKAVTDATGVHMNVDLYYSGWYENFQSAFATQANANGAVPFVQIEPSDVNIAAISHGAFDTYLETFATEVASYGARTNQGVIIGFGHEMNGSWYPWGYGHLAPAVFVAAWRHIVTIFRQQGADNVTWLWTVNVIAKQVGIQDPSRWWPGNSYVTWVGIDGYYLKPTWTFASVFGPTIKAIRALTLDNILISETGAPSASQPAKIADLFAGVHAYGLLGFVWFDANHDGDFALSGPATFAALRRGAETFKMPAA